MWHLSESDGTLSTYNNDFANGSTVIAATSFAIAAIILCGYLVISKWGLIGLLGLVMGVSAAWLLFAWASYKIAHRRWRVQKVAKELREAADGPRRT